jgi:hypothetical protein
MQEKKNVSTNTVSTTDPEEPISNICRVKERVLDIAPSLPSEALV